MVAGMGGHMTVTRGLTLVLVLLAVMGSASANGWLVDPPFAVQRDVFMGFDGPASGLEYSGVLDPVLKWADVVTIDGGSWFNGWWGVDNSNGQTTESALLNIHLGNVDCGNPLKLIWCQFDLMLVAPSQIAVSLIAPADSTFVDWGPVDVVWDPNGINATVLLAGVIEPNPRWEEIEFELAAGPGGIAAIDNVHIATACVPEPSLVGLLALGVLGLAARRRR